MPLFRRPDGDPVRDVPALRRLMPHLMPTRNESAVYFEQELDVTGTLAWLAHRNRDASLKEVSFFQVILCGIVRTLGQRPQMHQFVVGRRLYRRRHIELSFAVKKAFRDDAGLTTVKVRFEPGDTIADVSRRVNEAIQVGRGDRKTTSEKEMGLVTRLPRSILRLLLWGQRALDYFNLLPSSLIETDPLYASMFLANLGSVGLDAPFHHLYEYGTIPLFAVIGRIQKAPAVQPDGALAVRDLVRVRYTFDERIADGFYCASSLAIFKGLVEDPSKLERPPEPG